MKTEDIKLFHRVVEVGSLVETASLLNLAKSNISRRIKNLEKELGVLLFVRSGRSNSLTLQGEAFYNSTRPLISQFDDSIAALKSTPKRLQGHLRIQILPLAEMIEIAAMAFKFMEMHPDVSMEIIQSNDQKELVADQIDLGFRIGQSLEPGPYIAKEIRAVGACCYASPEYLATHGEPIFPQDISQHSFIRYRYPDGKVHNEITLGRDDDRYSISGKLVANSIPLIIQAGIRSQGIIYLPESMVQAEVEQGTLKRILPNIEPSIYYGWMVYKERRSLTPLVNGFVDFMIEQIEQHARLHDHC